MTIITTPISTAIGVAVAGYTSSDFLTPDAARNCQALLDRYGGVVYREAHVTDADLVAFSRALGEVVVAGTGAHPDHPETRHGSTRRCGGAAMAASLC
ncbi:hypothetical protein MCHIJ_14110 [Mycolicibacterium chitae]|uniref:Taurine catabolism dioxygenase TauD, TfdA family protein n=1 Tax=Mycolicibacterium chitae TaxID=1792 RepID=A0A3S4RLD2_MYCCI|nr:hypothetical protein MCHIJ_14110 [Mycolicibacterium chitae]VEG50799.1 Taurine catabolism dioxygenase TauD, TfdA family protein [Mycolicibacterium chitae]